MKMDALFPDDEPDTTEAIAAACARLGLPEEWSDAAGYEHSIVGGAVDGDRVAWVEQKSRTTSGGWQDVDFYLNMCAGDDLLREWMVETYNPYFGCTVHHLRWSGDEVLAIYREKHLTLACALGPSGPPRMRVLDWRWRLLGDVVLYASEARGLVERVHLPSLTRRSPLPYALAATHMADGACPNGPPLAEPAALQRALAERLPAPARPFADLLTGALAYRFWDTWPPTATSYEQAHRDDHRWNVPCWLPFYQYCASEAKAREELLAALDAAAAMRSGEADDVVELALRHVADRCREIAGACRKGHLPADASDSFWVEWSQEAFAGAQELFPAGMWATWQTLRPRARELDALARKRG